MIKPIAIPPISKPTAPKIALPKGAVDAHVHLIGDDFPLWGGRVEDPNAGSLDDWLAQFRHHQSILGLDRTVIVHSILYGADNSITLEATKRLGRGIAKAVCLLPDNAPESDLDALARAGTVGIRLNYVHGGILSWQGAKAMASALADRSMHIQMLANTHFHLAEIEQDVRNLPVPVVFDHIGWPDLGLGVNDTGFQALLRLLSDGHAYVKLSGAYRVSHPPYAAADDHVSALIAANPERCLWGTDWPHLMLGDARLPDAGILLNRLQSLTSADEQHRIFVTNPEKLYGFTPIP